MQRRNFVVYTVLMGGVEELQNPFPKGSTGYDRICFTDDPTLKSDAWDVRVLQKGSLGPARESRRPKLLPHRYLADYEWSLYVDNTVRFLTDPVNLLDSQASDQDSFLCFPHPLRDCLYQEAEEVIRAGFEKEAVVREQIDWYRSLGFPEHAGLIKGTVLLRRHNDAKVMALSEQWFEHVLRFSKRDQIAFPFVSWQSHFKPRYLDGQIDNNAWLAWPGFPNQKRVRPSFDPSLYRWRNPEAANSNLSPEIHFLQHFSEKKSKKYRPYRWELRRLANKYKSDKGNLYYNAHAFADIYEHYLSEYRKKPIKILELGLLRDDVQARNPGGPYDDAPSLRMWRDFFPKAEIFGFDIGDFSRVAPMPNVTIVRGDMGNPADLRRLIELSGASFDVIIDDASHASHHQQIALNYLFDHLKEGGFYFIEDLHSQPPSLEKPGVLKTRDVLLALSTGTIRPTEFLDHAALRRIRNQMSGIQFFDSQERVFGKIHTDALALITKRKKGLGDLVVDRLKSALDPDHDLGVAANQMSPAQIGSPAGRHLSGETKTRARSSGWLIRALRRKLR